MKNAIGPTAYVLNGIRDLPKIKPETLRVAADGKTYAGDYIFGTICNTTRMTPPSAPASTPFGTLAFIRIRLAKKTK